jgi:hypothetical protein
MLNYQASSGRRIYQMLDGLAGSYYPPGCFTYPDIDPGDYTAPTNSPSAIVDPFMQLHADLGIPRASIWEWGHCLAWNAPPGWPNAGVTYRDDTRRAIYTQEFLNYWYQACLNNNVTPALALYWDQQIGSNKGTTSNTNPDVRFSTDQTRAIPNTATVWRNAVTVFNAR